MAKYLLKRLGMAVLTLFVILLLLFIMVHSLPGSPFNNAEKLTEAQKAAMNAKYGWISRCSRNFSFIFPTF